jgi:hypothetical protein
MFPESLQLYYKLSNYISLTGESDIYKACFHYRISKFMPIYKYLQDLYFTEFFTPQNALNLSLEYPDVFMYNK